MLGQHGKLVSLPAFPFRANLLGLGEPDEVSHRPGDVVVVAVKETVPALSDAEGARDVPGHAGLLGQNQPAHAASPRPVGGSGAIPAAPDSPRLPIVAEALRSMMPSPPLVSPCRLRPGLVPNPASAAVWL